MDTGLLRNGYRPTQKWIQAYSKIDTDLLENGYRPTRKWMQTYPKMDTDLLENGYRPRGKGPVMAQGRVMAHLTTFC